jgi:hypothetical protein
MSANSVLSIVEVTQVKNIQNLRVLCCWVLVLCAVIEAGSIGLRNHRSVSLDINNGIESALAMRRVAKTAQIIFAGNSLVYEGISLPVLQTSLGNEVTVATAGIPGSTYYDWEYGLRALFARGSEPDVVVFGISPSQFLRAPAVTSLPVSRLWRSSEITAYYLDWRPGLATVGDLVLEHYSTFFSMRDVFRIYGRKQIAGYSSMVHEWGSHAQDLAVGDEDAKAATYLKRLGALQSECRAHAHLVLIVVPTRQIDDEADEPLLRHAASQLGIPVIEPIQEREWPIGQFQGDGYHLTIEAARQFSRITAGELAVVLGGFDRVNNIDAAEKHSNR